MSDETVSFIFIHLSSPEDMCEPMIESLLHVIIPRPNYSLQEVATTTRDGFASTIQNFQEIRDGIIDLRSKKTSAKGIRKKKLAVLI